MTIEVKVERIPWVPILVLTAIFATFGNVWVEMLPNVAGAPSWYAPGTIACRLFVPVLPAIFMIGAALIAKAIGKPISATTYTFLYAAAVSMMVFISFDAYPSNEQYFGILYDRLNTLAVSDLWPWFMAPPADVIAPAVTGGAAVPWGSFVPMIGFFWILMGAHAAFYIAIASIFRRGWVDVEKVPFPQTLVNNELVKKATSKEMTLKQRLGLPFLIGALLGVAFQLPLFLITTFPWFPDIYGWRTNTCNMGTAWLTASSPLAGIVGLAQFNKDPLMGAILYMAPLNILLGGWFWYLVFAILMQVAFTMGYYSGITGYDGCGRVWCGTTGYRIGEPFKWDVFSTAGVSTGIVIFYLILNRRYILETLKAATGGLSKEKVEEIEKDEPIPYKYAWTMMTASALLIILLWLVSGVGPMAAVVLLVTNFIATFAMTRVYSLVGYMAPAGSWYMYGPMRLVLPQPPSQMNTEWVVAVDFMHPTGQAASEGWGTPLLSSFSSYKMANLTGISSKSVFKVIAVVGALAPLLALIGTTWSIYTFGINRMPSAGSQWGSFFDSRGDPSSVGRRPAPSPWEPYMLGGIIFAGILSYLHARFVWFPFEPVGFLLATDGHALIEGIWTMCLAAWAAKTITLRIGGSKLYENVGVPIATGFVIGVIIISFAGGLALVVRFFVPY